MISPASTPSASVSQLQRQVCAQQEEIARLHQLMEKKEAEWEAAKAALFEQFRLAIERQFGPSTEKYRVAQGDLLINEAEAAVDEEDACAQDDAADDEVDEPTAPRQPAKRRSRGGRVALPPELPRVEVVHELPENARHCHDDGTELKDIGKEISEELHVVPAGRGNPPCTHQVRLPRLRGGRADRPGAGQAAAEE